MSDYVGTLFEHVESELKQLISDKLISLGEKPEDYMFVNGFVHFPLMQMLGQSTYKVQVTSIALANNFTHQFIFFNAHSLIKEIHENREKNLKRCSVTSISQFKVKKEESK